MRIRKMRWAAWLLLVTGIGLKVAADQPQTRCSGAAGGGSGGERDRRSPDLGGWTGRAARQSGADGRESSPSGAEIIL